MWNIWGYVARPTARTRGRDMAVIRFGRIKIKIRTPSTKLVDMLSQRFGRLTVIAAARSDKRGAARWLCRCDCGGKDRLLVSRVAAGGRVLISEDGITIVRGDSLRRGVTTSCGCIAIEATRQRALDRPKVEPKPRKPRVRRPPLDSEWQAVADKAFAKAMAKATAADKAGA
jgi:hypothetical protein